MEKSTSKPFGDSKKYSAVNSAPFTVPVARHGDSNGSRTALAGDAIRTSKG
jgi:hypothetical protein